MNSTSYKNKLNNPAKYRNLIQFEELQTVQDDEANWVDKWVKSELGTTYAQIRTVRGREFFMAGAEQAKIFTRINIRYRKDVEEKYYELGEKLRLRYNNRIFNIEYMNNLEERNIELEIIANEVR